MREKTTSVIGRVLALLAKAESTEYEAEAATYLEAANRLMIRYQIEESDLTPEEADQIVTERVTVGNNRANHFLFAAAATSVSVRLILHAPPSRRADRMGSLVGFATDVRFTQALYASLLVQRERFLAREERPPWVNARSFNHSFRLGYAARVTARLEEARRDSTGLFESESPGSALVLASRQDLVNARAAAEFPRLRPGRPVRVSAWSAYDAGMAAGGLADTSGGRGNLAADRRAVEA